MAQKPRKATPAKGKATQPKTASGSKDTKTAFGTAAPKKVVPATAKTSPKQTKPRKPAQAEGDSIAGSAMRTVKAAANVAVGAVATAARGTASLAASVVGKGTPKAKAKAK
jgi:hypothetical protein